MKTHRVFYFLLVILSVPLLPVMIILGTRLRRRSPIDEGPDDIFGIEGFGNKKVSLVCIGESTIAGAGTKSHKSGFTGTLAKKLALKHNAEVGWEVVAKSGYSTKKVADILLNKINTEKPDIFILGVGANDAFEMTSPYTWRKNMKRIIKRLKAINPYAQIVIINIPPVKSFPSLPYIMRFFFGQFAEILTKETVYLLSNEKYQNITFLDEPIDIIHWAKEISPSASIQDVFCDDGIHPSPATYQVWAREVCERMNLTKFSN